MGDSLEMPFVNNMTKRQKRKLQNMSNDQVASLRLRVSISDCCKRMNLAEARKLYLKARNDSGDSFNPPTDTLFNLLSLAAGFGEQGSGSGPPREIDPPSDLEFAKIIFHDIREKNIKISESSYTAMIRCYCTNNQYKQALALLSEMQHNNCQPKLRTYTHLYEILNKTKQIESIFEIYHQMTGEFNLIPTEADYLNILQCCCHTKDIRFYGVLEAFMEDILVPSQAAWDTLTRWFVELQGTHVSAICEVQSDGVVRTGGRSWQLQSIDLTPETRVSLLHQIDQMATLRAGKRTKRKDPVPSLVPPVTPHLNNSEAPHSHSSDTFSALLPTDRDQQSSHVSLPPSTSNSRQAASLGPVETNRNEDRNSEEHLTTGKNQRSQENERNFPNNTTISSRDNHYNSNKNIGSDRGNDGSHGGDGRDEKLVGKWTEFKNWLIRIQNSPVTEPPHDIGNITNSSNNNSNKRFNLVIDGANVGYYKQNFPNQTPQLNLEQIDCILHYTKDVLGYQPLVILHSRHCSQPAPIISRWRELNLLYETPAGCNDDWFWLFATVTVGCHVLTNDLMRDHHFCMLSPRWFERWKERHQIRFSFTRVFTSGAVSASSVSQDSTTWDPLAQTPPVSATTDYGTDTDDYDDIDGYSPDTAEDVHQGNSRREATGDASDSSSVAQGGCEPVNKKSADSMRHIAYSTSSSVHKGLSGVTYSGPSNIRLRDLALCIPAVYSKRMQWVVEERLRPEDSSSYIPVEQQHQGEQPPQRPRRHPNDPSETMGQRHGSMETGCLGAPCCHRSRDAVRSAASVRAFFAPIDGETGDVNGIEKWLCLIRSDCVHT